MLFLDFVRILILGFRGLFWFCKLLELSWKLIGYCSVVRIMLDYEEEEDLG